MSGYRSFQLEQVGGVTVTEFSGDLEILGSYEYPPPRVNINIAGRKYLKERKKIFRKRASLQVDDIITWQQIRIYFWLFTFYICFPLYYSFPI